MNLNSARQAWHDCTYSAWDSQGAFIEQLGLLGAMVQTTEKQRKASHAVHQALAGRVQAAIATLPSHLQAFGNFMYSPVANIDEKEEAEELVFMGAYNAGPKMTARKFAKARHVAQAVVLRYQRLHQGGQSEGEDPLPTVEKMRLWILAVHGVSIVGDQWARDWGDFVERCFDACNQLDKSALAPVSMAISTMKEAA